MRKFSRFFATVLCGPGSRQRTRLRTHRAADSAHQSTPGQWTRPAGAAWRPQGRGGCTSALLAGGLALLITLSLPQGGALGQAPGLGLYDDFGGTLAAT